MEIRVTRSEFLGELAPMQGIVERKTTIPVLSHLLLTAREDKLHLAATDLDVSLTSWCDADVKREGGIAVQAKKLMEIIRSLTGERRRIMIERLRNEAQGRKRVFGFLSPFDSANIDCLGSRASDHPVQVDAEVVHQPEIDLREIY